MKKSRFSERQIISIFKQHEGGLKELIDQKINYLTHHPGFLNRIIVFNTINNECITIGNTPMPAQVTINKED